MPMLSSVSFRVRYSLSEFATASLNEPGTTQPGELRGRPLFVPAQAARFEIFSSPGFVP